jgi:Reverse transcriptase (RNA-dependent DNA polymerase)
LGVAALEDKIVQQAVVTVLNQIYEEDFLGFSYGFRPGRSPHQALDALSYALMKKKVNYVLDADIQGFFDNLDKSWLIKFVEHRVADPRFGRYAEQNRGRRGEGKPETFDLLGFTHISGKNSKGHYTVRRMTIRKRMRKKLQEIKQQLRQRMHDPVPQTGGWLRSVLQGYYNYYAVPGNLNTLGLFRNRVLRLWGKTLRRRSQKSRFTWARRVALAEQWLPRPQKLHPYPEARFAASHPR